MKTKLIVVGHARHGKDTVCNMLTQYGYTFKSSSAIANEKIIFPVLKEKYGYITLEECFNDRVNHRGEWFNLISEYNTPVLSKLGEEIFSQSDIYCGLRNLRELIALKNLPQYKVEIIYVDASKRLPLEPYSSMTIPLIYQDHLIDNNYTELDLQKEALSLIKWLQKEENYVNSYTDNGE